MSFRWMPFVGSSGEEIPLDVKLAVEAGNFTHIVRRSREGGADQRQLRPPLSEGRTGRDVRGEWGAGQELPDAE